MKILALGYKKGSGKNAFAGFISTHLRCEHPHLSVKEISFARKLKDIAWQLYSWVGLERGIFYENSPDSKEKTLPSSYYSPREIWIGVGNALRNFDPDIWTNYALWGVQTDIVIITDLRFQNEAEAVLRANGKLIKIERPGQSLGADPAEVDLDTWMNWDHIIANNGTLRDLNMDAIRIAELYARKINAQ